MLMIAGERHEEVRSQIINAVNDVSNGTFFIAAYLTAIFKNTTNQKMKLLRKNEKMIHTNNEQL